MAVRSSERIHDVKDQATTFAQTIIEQAANRALFGADKARDVAGTAKTRVRKGPKAAEESQAFSAAGTASAHGVRQVCPPDVLISAPGGVDSNCSGTVGVAVRISSPELEQAASAIAQVKIDRCLTMGLIPRWAPLQRRDPRGRDHKSRASPVQPPEKAFPRHA